LYSNFILFNCEEKNISLFKEKGKVVYNGISVDQFKDLPAKGHYRSMITDTKEKLIFLFLGRLNYTQKGIDILLPALKKLTIKNKLAHLILVLKPDLSKQLHPWLTFYKGSVRLKKSYLFKIFK